MFRETSTSRRIAAASILALAFVTGCDRAVDELKQKAMGAATKAISDKINEKVGETVNQVATEKIVEASLEKNGMKDVKADLGKDGAKVSLTDKDGTKLSMASGEAVKLGEADFGVPFYPGAKLDVSKSVKMITGDHHQYTVSLEATDKFDKVSSFYRDKVKAMAAGKTFTELADGTSNIKLMLADEKAGSMLLVSVESPEGDPATITLFTQGKNAP